MNHGQVRYGNGYTPYPYGTPEHNASTTSVSSLASTSSKIINLFKSGKDKDKKSKKRKAGGSNDGPPVPEKDYPPAMMGYPYAGGKDAVPSSSSLSLSLSISDASGHSATGSMSHRNGVDTSTGHSGNGLFKLGKGRKKKEKQAENISTPWNVKHEVHISDALSGFPPEWQSSLIQLGYSQAEIQQMIDQKRRQPTVHTNLIPIGPNASTPSATTSLNTSLLQNQSISLSQLVGSGSSPFNSQQSVDTNPSGIGMSMRYPSPPQQFALPTLPPHQPFNLSLQTTLGRQYGNSPNSSPVTYAPRPIPVPSQMRNVPDRTGSPSSLPRTGSPALRGVVQDRADSPAGSIRSHPHTQAQSQHSHQVSLSGSEHRASPVPSLRKDPSGPGASGLSNSPISNSPIGNMDSTGQGRPSRDINNVAVTTTIAMGLASNTMSSTTPVTTKPPGPLPVPNNRTPTRPPPPPPLFGPSVPGISTNRANAYKPPTAIAVQDEEDGDEVPLSSIKEKSSVLNNRTPARPPPPPPLFGPSVPGISTNRANTYKPPAAIAVQDEEDEDEIPLSSLKEKSAPVATLGTNSGSGVNGKGDSFLPTAGLEILSPASATPTSNTTMSSIAAPPTTSNPPATQISNAAVNPSAASTLPTTYLDANPSNLTNTSTPTPTPISGLSSDAPPRLSLGIPRISFELGKLDLGLGLGLGLGEHSTDQEKKDSRDNVEWSDSLFSALPSATAFGSFRSSVILPGSSPRGSPGLSPAGGRPSPMGSGESPGISPGFRGESRLSPASTGSSPGVSPISAGKAPSPVPTPSPMMNRIPGVGPRMDIAEVDPLDRSSVMSSDSIASSNIFGHEAFPNPPPLNHAYDNRDYRESVSTDSTSRQSMSSFGGMEEDEMNEFHEGLGETVVVARATAVKLARAPSVALRSGFDAFAVGRQQRLGVANTGAGAGQYSPMTGYSYYNGLDEEEEEDEDDDDSDEDSDEGSDDDEEDPNSRHTIRLDDINANRLMDAVMRNQGELTPEMSSGDDGRPLSTSTLKTSRPISTSTVSTSRPISSSTVRLDNSESTSNAKKDEGEVETPVDEEDSSALDDWLEANETEEPVKEETVEEQSEYDDADYPLSAITLSSDTTFPPQERAQSPGSDYSPVDGQAEGDRSATPTAEGGPANQHARDGSVSGSGSSHAGSGSTSHRAQRSSMIYAPKLAIPPRYQQILRPVMPFIHPGDPTTSYSELQQVAEGESGGIYAASGPSTGVIVAIKRIVLKEETKVRIETLARELTLLEGLQHVNILTYSAVWLVNDKSDFQGDVSTELWIRMDLMERSLADLLGLLEDGLVLEERHVARFAKDVASALAFLEEKCIAHRDVRSDNLLISPEGVIKLADFATAIQISKGNTLRNDQAGIIYWQAPEIRRGVYDAMKVDVWSLGATVWELVEGETPFESDPNGPSDRLPEITRTDLQQVSQGLLGFLNLCEAPAERRPKARSLLETPFIRACCSRDEVLRLLSQALDIERAISLG